MLVSEQTGEVPRAVEHAQHFDSTRDETVENEVFQAGKYVFQIKKMHSAIALAKKQSRYTSLKNCLLLKKI